MYSLQRSRLSGWPLFRSFYLRRIFRIYPLSILAVMTALALHLDSDVNGVAGLSYATFPGRLSVAAHLLLLQNVAQVKSIVNVLWSLPFEVQMYVVLPFLYVWLERRAKTGSLLILWVVSLITASVQPHIMSLARLSILIFVPNFLAGVIAFSVAPPRRVRSFLWPIFILALIGTFTLRPNQPTGWALCLALGLAIPCFRDLSTPWLCTISKRIATYSYGIYLSHQFSFWIVFGLLTSWSLWFRIPFLLALLVAIPILLYHGVENPMIQFGNSLSESLARRADHSPVVALKKLRPSGSHPLPAQGPTCPPSAPWPAEAIPEVVEIPPDLCLPAQPS